MKNIRGYIEHIRESDFEYPTGMNLINAVISGNIDRCKKLIDAGAFVSAKLHEYENRTPLHWAAYYDRTVIAKLLIDAGADVDALDKNRWTPLHQAATSGVENVVKLLIDAGAKLDIKNNNSDTALLCAVIDNNPGVVKLLIDAGADVTLDGENGWSPLHWAVLEGHTHIVKLLIDKNIGINKIDINNRTPLYVAIIRGKRAKNAGKYVNIAKILIQAGAEIDLKTHFKTFKEFSDFFGGNIKWIPQDLIPPEWRESAKFTGTFGGFY
jgi:serine/threonine-protein phosphatase 6 regulatory ankyrin repeat subunit A